MPYFRPEDIPDVDELNESLFFLAASNDDVKLFEDLFDGGVNPHAPDSYGETVILRVLRSNSLNVFDFLCKRSVAFPAGAVGEAAGRGYLEMLGRLLALGFDVDERDSFLWTPIMHAALMGQTSALELLVTVGASVNEVDANGMTALHHAATAGSTDAIRVLLKHSARADILDHGGRKPIDWARDNHHAEAIQLFARATASPAA